MTINILARTIPNQVRKLLLENDMIEKAVSVKDNTEMKYLLKVWHDYIEPNKEESDCPICIENILTNFKQMNEILIKLENEYQYLKHL